MKVFGKLFHVRYALLATCLLSSWLTAGQAQAFTFDMTPPGQAPGNYNYRPIPQNNARGTPLSQQGSTMPFSQGPGGSRQFSFQRQWSSSGGQSPGGYYPGYGQSTSRTSDTPPYLETELETDTAFVQQQLILTLRIVSGSNVATASPELPKTDKVVFKKIGEPTAEVRTRRGKREIVNKFLYLVTPLRSGDITLDPIKISGNLAGSGYYGSDSHFEATSPVSHRLQVKPADPRVRPWLPLHNLELSARLNNAEKIDEGQPVTLVLQQTAEGISGSQLASLENQLQSADYRLYREKTEFDGKVSNNGRLMGQRVDHFTLVPQHGGKLRIPAIEVNWWNVDYERPETTILPIRQLAVAGSLLGDVTARLSGGPFPTGSAWVFWTPLVLIAFFIGLYWTILWARSKEIGQWLNEHLGVTFEPLQRAYDAIASKLAPRRYMHMARRGFARLLPRSFKLGFCARVADTETDPETWSQVLRFLVNKHLHIPAQLPMPALAQHLVANHPGANQERVNQLLDELDGAVFGHREIADFEQWKRDFRREIRPHIFAWFRRPGSRHSRERLPDLNPRST